ncbi:MAG: DedA family protein, partial [Williamsia herbipolensis]|nr:DedA family protein [Williamsia herbipolensis]
MIQGLFDWLLDLPPWLVLFMAFLFPALEASVFV